MESIGDGTTVGTGMNLKLNGLAEGSYWLVETQAPDGYNKLTAPVKITITKSDTTNVNDWTIKQMMGWWMIKSSTLRILQEHFFRKQVEWVL